MFPPVSPLRVHRQRSQGPLGRRRLLDKAFREGAVTNLFKCAQTIHSIDMDGNPLAGLRLSIGIATRGGTSLPSSLRVTIHIPTLK